MLLSHTVFQEVDNVICSKAYAVERGVDDKKWNLVTGDKKVMLYRKSYLAVKMGKPERII
jgi:protein SCO1/2